MPLITLRALIITPNSKLQITAARKSSIAALDYANAQEQKHLAVFCQLNEQDEVPGFNELHKTGVICNLINLTQKDEHTSQCLFSGFSRIKLIEIIDDEKVAFRQARVQVLPEEECEPKDIADTQSVIKSSLQYAIDSSDNAISISLLQFINAFSHAYNVSPVSLLNIFLDCSSNVSIIILLCIFNSFF